jgi:hypothetical protein
LVCYLFGEGVGIAHRHPTPPTPMAAGPTEHPYGTRVSRPVVGCLIFLKFFMGRGRLDAIGGLMLAN